MHFEWDLKKATANRLKHGVTFEEATSAMRVYFRLQRMTLTTRIVRRDS